MYKSWFRIEVILLAANHCVVKCVFEQPDENGFTELAPDKVELVRRDKIDRSRYDPASHIKQIKIGDFVAVDYDDLNHEIKLPTLKSIEIRSE